MNQKPKCHKCGYDRFQTARKRRDSLLGKLRRRVRCRRCGHVQNG